MPSCKTLYNSKKTKSLFDKEWKKWSNNYIKQNGGLPEFAFRDFKKSYKRGFMKICKLIMKNKKNKTKKI